jgi:hypothetical protein
MVGMQASDRRDGGLNVFGDGRRLGGGSRLRLAAIGLPRHVS